MALFKFNMPDQDGEVTIYPQFRSVEGKPLVQVLDAFLGLFSFYHVCGRIMILTQLTPMVHTLFCGHCGSRTKFKLPAEPTIGQLVLWLIEKRMVDTKTLPLTQQELHLYVARKYTA